MKMTEIFMEMALPTETIRAQRYYHGTSSGAAALKIMKDGIQPPDLELAGRKKNGNLTPVAGKVYITPDISYAQIYALGGAFVGSFPKMPYKGNEEKFKHLINPNPSSRYYGRYGYIFVIDGQQLQDIQPDEDSVGEFLHRAMTDQIKNDPSEVQAIGQQLLMMAKIHLAPSTLKKVKSWEYQYYAKAGKILLKRMPDWMKQKMVEMGFHCAHTGPLIPIETWRIDKAKVGWLQEDGSNFFEIAKRVK